MDVDNVARRWKGWGFAAVVAAVTAGLCAFATFWLPGLLGYHQWLTLGDAKWTVQSAQFVSWGGAGSVYSANPQFLPLPGYLFLLTPAVVLGDHLGYITPLPFPLRYPSMWLVVAPVFFLTGVSAVFGVDYLADTLRVPRARRRLVVAATGLFVVIPTVCWAGHPEDMVALALSCFSVGLLFKQRYFSAAWMLSLAVLMQSWAGLLIPLLVAAAPAGRRMGVLVRSSLAPVAVGGLLLAFDFHDAFRSLVVQPMQGNGQHLPWWGLAHTMTMAQEGAQVAVRVGSTSRSLAVVAAIVAAVVVARRPTPATFMTAASVVLLMRGISETQVWCYYLAPAGAFMALAAARPDRNQTRWVLGGVSAFVAYSFAAGSYNLSPFSLPAWLGLAILVASGVGILAAAYGDGSRQGHAEGLLDGLAAPSNGQFRLEPAVAASLRTA